MNRQGFIDEIKFRLTGDILESEIEDAGYSQIVDMSLREIQRYIRDTELITVPFSKCIDCTKLQKPDGTYANVSSITKVYHATGMSGESGVSEVSMADPLYASYWQTVAGSGNLYNFQDASYNYMTWLAVQQLRNTTSTDLFFRFDKYSQKLYINVSCGNPQTITIEYIPKFTDVEQIKSDFWIDILMQVAVATAKITVGRIRSRYQQSNALWTQDGETILAEGREELNALREHLVKNTQLCYPID